MIGNLSVRRALWLFALLAAALATSDAASAQQPARTITGRVVDATTLQPLVSVQVYIPELQLGTISGQNGVYSLPNVPAGTHTITASVIGYTPQSQEVTVGDASLTVNFQLSQTAVALDEIIAVGYGSQTRATVSGAVSAVNEEELETQAFTQTADALQGLVQGINIRMMTSTEGNSGQTTTPGTGGAILGESYDGRPGAPATMEIRNMGEPLIVIDGVPSTTADFNNLNPQDIANISILKDASAAVYGFRAANGVVLITTKRGDTEQAPQVRVDGYYGWQNFTRYHYKPLTNAYEYLFSVLDSQQNRHQDPSLTPEELEKWRIGAPGYESVDHWPLAINNPNAAQYNMNGSISGGSPLAQYYLSVGHVQQDYNINDMTWGRSNLAATLSVNLTDNLRIGSELRARNEVRDEIALLGNPSNVHTALLIAQSSWPHDRPYTGPNNDLINYEVRYPVRSVGMMSQEVSGDVQDVRRQGSGNFWMEYQFPFGTTVKATGSVRIDTRDLDLARKSIDMYCHDEETDTYFVCFNTGDRTRQQLKERTDGLFGNITVNQSFDFGRHSASAVAFVEMDGSERGMTYAIGQSPTNYTHIMEQARLTEFGQTWGIERRSSVGGRLDYDFDQKYLISALARYDGSYLYAPGKRWGLFPGVSVGWRITQEPFLRDRFGFLDELKLRASWGQTGREQGVDPWDFLGGATYNVGNGSVLDGAMVYGVRPRGIPVTNLSWVTSTSKNIGVDAIMLDGRLSFEADLFERSLSGLPDERDDVLLPQELGYDLPEENLNSDATRGFEFLVRWQEQIGRVQYMVAPNLTVARTMPTFRYMQRFGNSLDEWRDGEVGRWEEINFGYEVIGQFESFEEIENHPVMIDGQGNRLLLPGDLIYKDWNEDGIIDGNDQVPIGFGINQTPIVSFGMGTQFTFAGISLTANFAGGAMYDHARGSESKNLSQGGHNMPKYAMDRWRRADPFNPQSEWLPGRYPPIRISQTNPSFNRNDTFWRTNVRFLRLRRIELAYNVPDNFAGFIGLSGLRVYTNMQNPFSWDNTQHYNLDPEMTRNAGLSYPTIRLTNVGFSATVGGAREAAVAVPVPDGDDD